MSTTIELPWQEPLTFAPLLDELEHAALLYSGQDNEEEHTSYLCLGAEEVCAGSDLLHLKQQLTTNQLWHENFWVGWLGYGLKNQLEKLPTDQPSIISSDDYCFFKPKTIYRFDHQEKLVEYAGEHLLENRWESFAPKAVAPVSEISALHSNMSKSEYLEHVETILEAIRAGTCYQANLTRKFYGDFAEKPTVSGLFTKLCDASPANYSALIRAGDISVISSSPELFLDIDATGKIATRPIKGTIARGANVDEDQELKTQLANSSKDRSENLMIVDLMRNDLSRVCVEGSVKVDALYDITTHAHIHHMSSLVSGKLREAIHPLDAVMACFPPGSMTGAPKIKAMEICSGLEKQARGIYSGALGWFAGDGTARSSVVIRTLIVNGNSFEFQTGGGIVADSSAEKEFEETLDKAKAICGVLGISEQDLRNL